MDLKQVQVNPDSLTPAAFKARFNASDEEAAAMADQASKELVFRNEKYQVTLSQIHPTNRTGWPPFVHLSIIPLDGQPIHNWADLQDIKNSLMGPEFEAIEVYPAESRLVDCGANYHLWVFIDPSFRVPMGWAMRRVQK